MAVRMMTLPSPSLWSPHGHGALATGERRYYQKWFLTPEESPSRDALLTLGLVEMIDRRTGGRRKHPVLLHKLMDPRSTVSYRSTKRYHIISMSWLRHNKYVVNGIVHGEVLRADRHIYLRKRDDEQDELLVQKLKVLMI